MTLMFALYHILALNFNHYLILLVCKDVWKYMSNTNASVHKKYTRLAYIYMLMHTQACANLELELLLPWLVTL